MADIQDLQSKVEKAELKVEKCKATIERHKKALDKKVGIVIKEVGIDLTGKSVDEVEKVEWTHRGSDHSWLIYDVTRKLNDIAGAHKKLSEAETILSNWQEKLSIAVNRERYIADNAPQVIKDFLEQWKSMAFEWHVKKLDDYREFRLKLQQERDEAIISFVKSNPVEYSRYLENGEIHSYYSDLINIRGRGLEEHMKGLMLDWKSIKQREKDFAGGVVLHLNDIRDEVERLNWLDKTLEQSKNSKMLDLIQRISKSVGEITDASNLEISDSGNINGYVIGDSGEAWLETITAGGWNVQCWHYRTIVKPKKK